MAYLGAIQYAPGSSTPINTGSGAPGGILVNPVPFIQKKPKPKPAPKPPVVLKPSVERPHNPLLDAFKPVVTIMPVLKPLPPSGDTGTPPVSIMPAVPPITFPTSGGGGGGGGSASSGGGGGSGGDGGDYNEATLFSTGGLDSLKNINPLFLIGGAVALYFLTRKR